jgi:signal transduction histidine kinase
MLLIRHSSGSLEAAVSQLRYRNLSMSVAILLVLAASVVMLLVATRRAQLLAERQIQFVAGVTHELRTPLSVICTAGDNLSGGIVTDAAQVRGYGELVRIRATVEEMVEQVLEYAGARPAARRGQQSLKLS